MHLNIVARWGLALALVASFPAGALTQELRSSVSDDDDVFAADSPSVSDFAEQSRTSDSGEVESPQSSRDLDADLDGDQLASQDTIDDDAGLVPPVVRRARRAAESEPYAPLGLRTGAFLLFPSIGISGTYSDNVDQAAHRPQDDFGLRVTPVLRVESDWVRHRFTFNGSADLIFYQKQSDFDERSANAAANLRLDVRRTTTAELIGEYRLSETSASDREVPDAASGRRRDHEFGASAALTHTMNRLRATATVGGRYLIFDDVDLAGGGTENNSDRDYVEPSVALRLGYETSPAIQPFVEAGYRPRFHRRSRDRSGLRRDSHGGFLRAGVDLNLSPVWAGNVAARYDFRMFDDSSLETVHAFGVDADVTWRPTQLTRVVFTAASGIDESASSGVSGSRTYEGAIAISHNLRDNVVLGATAGLEFSDFIGASDEELRLTGGLSVSYLISREIELLAGYEITGFESTQPGSDYIENQVTAGFRFRL